MITIRRKRGDTFRLRFKRDGGIAGVTVTAVLTGPRPPIPLVVVPVDEAEGLFELNAPGSTDTWPTGRYACDIRYARAGQVQRTPTFFIQLLEAITP